ncbi:MAG TPA: DUF6351 family protein, partial [Dehalococcoidia bacterium]|nr:DUF6351 family protein [Dehalococcoidia bacterium]
DKGDSMQTRALFACLLLAGMPALAAPQLPPHNVEIVTLSNRADLISGGDALVEVRLPDNLKPEKLALRLNGRDVRGQFQYVASGHRLVALLTGLLEGENELVADANGNGRGRPYATLTITNHSSSGPVFSGTQMQPWICATKDGRPVQVSVPGTNLSTMVASKVSGLDADPVDDKCNTASKVTYYYQPKAKQGSACTFTIAGADPCFVPYSLSSPPARAEIADFTNDRGDTAKSIVRVERGAMNRGIYELVVFHDPAVASSALAPQKGWNGKLLWMFGASAAASRFQTATTTNTIFNDDALRRGFMVAQSSLNNNGTNANHVLAAETLMMVKERIVEQYGPIRYTIGNGCSGGSIQQHTIASSYPGLLDGIQPNCSYMDQFNIEMEIKDCGLLAGNYFVSGAGASLPADKRAAIGGQLNPGFCQVWVGSFVPAYDPKRSANCGPGFPTALVYDPVLRPDGIRCDLLDHEANRIGTFIDIDGVRKANKIFDNIGVQYGLRALREGKITPEEFVQLNEGIGSYSADLVWSAPAGLPAARVAAQASTLERLYFTAASGDARFLSQVAIIDLRGSQNPNGDIHANWRSWSMRERLDKANGTHANQVIWAFTPGLAPGAALARKAFVTMDAWLALVEADSSARSRAEKIIANRPSGLSDLCYPTAGATDAELEPGDNLGLDTAACPVTHQNSPRQVAGGPLSEDIFKCQLRPIDFADPVYAALTSAQRARLQAVFPSGVCDYSRPGVGQQTSPGWVTFSGPTPQPLPPAPTSQP